MNYLKTINKRSVYHHKHDPIANWSEGFPKANWLLFAFVEGSDKSELARVSAMLIENNCCYVCCSGEEGHLLHDMVDLALVMREVDGNYLSPFDAVMTTWNANLEDEFWFSIYAAHNDPEIIDKIICLDLSKNGIEGELKDLLTRFASGYIPPL